MQDVKEFFFTLAGSDDAKDEYFYYHVDKDCIRHLFAVASSWIHLSLVKVRF